MKAESKKDYCDDALQHLEYAYSGAKMMDDIEEMTRIARAIEDIILT